MVTGCPDQQRTIRESRRRCREARRSRTSPAAPATHKLSEGSGCEPAATPSNLPARRRVQCRDALTGAAWLGGDPRFGAPIASHLSTAPLRANAANGVTGYDQATLLGSGPCNPQPDVEPGRCTMPTPPPRHLRPSRPRHLPSSRPQHRSRSHPRHLPTSRLPRQPISPPRHLPTSRWPWRLLLVAVGLTSGVLAALAASAILPPQSSPLRRAPAFALATVPTQPPARSVSTAPTGPRAPTTAPSRSTPTAATGPRAISRPTSAGGPAAAGPTTSSQVFSTLGATSTQPPVTDPTTTAAPPTTAPTTTAVPTTTTLATTTSTKPPTSEPTTTGAESTSTTGSAIP
jgi:hypothetical protein